MTSKEPKCDNPQCSYTRPYHPAMLTRITTLGTFCANCIATAVHQMISEGENG